jgi:hypothetical protein
VAFTFRTITHTFTEPNQAAAALTVTFHLPREMTNGSQTILPGDVDATLDGSGGLSVVLAANDDPGTVPADVQWQVTIDGPDAPPLTYSITVPSAGTGSLDLAALLPGEAQVN